MHPMFIGVVSPGCQAFFSLYVSSGRNQLHINVSHGVCLFRNWHREFSGEELQAWTELFGLRAQILLSLNDTVVLRKGAKENLKLEDMHMSTATVKAQHIDFNG